MLKLIRKYKTLLITISFAYVFVVFSLVTTTKYSIIMPGGLTDVTENIRITDGAFNSDNSFNTIYVTSYDQMTFFQYIIALGNKKYDVYETPQSRQDISRIDNHKRNQVSKVASYQYSLIHAFTLASQKNSSIKIDYELNGAVIYYRPGRISEINIGDLVVGFKLNGIEYSFDNDMSPAEIKEILDIGTTNKNVTLIINRNNVFAEFEISLANSEFLSFYPDYNIKSTIPKVELPGLDSDIGGPSGGLLQTMDLYARLLDLNINCKVAGTGTLDYDGTVNKIGGAVQKVYTAINYNVDLFFITEKNWNDIKEMTLLGKFTKYYRINTFSDAVTAMEDLTS